MTTAPLRARPRTEAIEIGLSAAARASIAEGLQSILGATYRLMVRTQIHHWNVVGAVFHPLHVMTEEQYRDMFEAIDTIAERIRALGHPTAAPEIRTEKTDVAVMTAARLVDDLVAGHEALCRELRQVAEAADEAGDGVTNDMLIARLAFHEKVIWMLRATSAT